MEYKTPQLKKQIRQRNLRNADDVKYLLQVHGGIFPDNIEEFANKISRRHKKLKNHAA